MNPQKQKNKYINNKRKKKNEINKTNKKVDRKFYSHWTPGRDRDHHYPAGAEFLTFVYFFFLIIKCLWFTILFNGRIFQFFCQNFCSAQFFGVLDGVDAKKAEISRSRIEVKSALFRIVFNITVLSELFCFLPPFFVFYLKSLAECGIVYANS